MTVIMYRLLLSVTFLTLGCVVVRAEDVVWEATTDAATLKDFRLLSKACAVTQDDRTLNVQPASECLAKAELKPKNKQNYFFLSALDITFANVKEAVVNLFPVDEEEQGNIEATHAIVNNSLSLQWSKAPALVWLSVSVTATDSEAPVAIQMQSLNGCLLSRTN